MSAQRAAEDPPGSTTAEPAPKERPEDPQPALLVPDDESPLADALLARLPEAVRRLITAAFEPVAYEFGEVLVREGDAADAILIVRTGRARIVRRGPDGEEVALGSIGPGAVVGELAVLRDQPRSATVRATTPITADRLSAAVLRALVASEQGAAQLLEEAARRYEISDLLRLASPLARVAGQVLDDLVARLEPVVLRADATLMSVGELADALYLVESGRLVVEVADGAGTRPVGFLRRGDVTGERGVVTRTRRDATVRAIEDCRLLRLSATDLDAVVAAHPALRTSLEQLADSYDHQALVRIPLDFAGEALVATTSLGALPAGDGAQSASPAPPAPVPSAPAPPNSRGRRSWRRGFGFVRQIDEADCAVASLRMVCQAYGKRVPHHYLRDLLRTTADGTSAAGIARAAQALGLDAHVNKRSRRSLGELTVPAIAHVDGYHWVVVFRVTNTAVTVADPAVGIRRIRLEEFQARWSGIVVEMALGAGFVPGGRRLSVPEWAAPLLRPHVRSLAAFAGLAGVLSTLELSIAVVTQVVIDAVLARGAHGTVPAAFAVLAAVVIVLTLATLFQQILVFAVARAVDRDSLELLSGHLFALPLPYFQARRTGDLQRRLSGLRDARTLAVSAGSLSVALSTQLLAAVGLLFYYSWPIGVLFCVAMPACALVARLSAARLQPVAAAVEQAAAKHAARQVEAIQGIETVKVSAAEDQIAAGLRANQDQVIIEQGRQDRMRATAAAATQGIGFFVLAAFLALGTALLEHQALSVGALVACLTVVALATGRVQLFASLAASLQHARVLLDRLEDVFAAPAEQDPGSGAAPVAGLSGRITLEHVSVALGGATILSDICVDITAGSTVAVVGRSGSGKTTLARCIAGLVAPTTGTILFDGLDSTDLDHRQLRRHLGVVLQEAFLFSDTIARNIALGSDLEPQLVEQAARLAHVHEFVQRLPLGYDTAVGDSGLALSGGQRQRIAIARALYRQPAVLILDEATSALDADSERAVQEGLARALEGRTAIIIAHRLSTIRHADRILVLDGGRLVEHGTHSELVARRGLYFLLASQQLEL